jgi:hypothetical protein
MKTREQIITDMCYTWDTECSAEEQEMLWQVMAKLFDTTIAPYVTFRVVDSTYLCGND